VVKLDSPRFSASYATIHLAWPQIHCADQRFL